MSEGTVFSPSHDCLTTPKESLKTPKFREFHEMSGCLASLKSPRDLDSINTPLPLPSSEPLLSTPTLGTPRTADPWQNIFTLGTSPLALASNCSSPTTPTRGGGRDPRPSDLPLESNIGLSSPHDGVLAKRRKLKNLNSSHSRSVESDSNSCDTPTTDSDSVPRDLSKKSERERSRSDSSPPAPEEHLVSPRLSDLDRVRDRVGAFAISSSQAFKHPNPLASGLLPAKDVMAHPSPLAMPSPNWSTVSRMMSKDGLALQTPKVLDNFVFDVLPPNTPNSLKVNRERSPEHSHPLNYEKRGSRPCLPESPPPPYPVKEEPALPYPEDLSVQKPHPGLPSREVKEEPADWTGAPRDFPPYYLAPGINPQHFQPSYRGGERPASPPASPPAITSQYQRQFYGPGMPRHPALSSVLAPHYEGGHGHWWGHGGHDLGGQGNGHLAQQAAHLDKYWRHPEPGMQGLQPYSNLKPNLDKVKCEQRLSTDSQDYSVGEGQAKKKVCRKNRAEGDPESDADPNQPPKKRGKGKKKDTGGQGPKRVFICPHCQRSYDWNYNLNRHLKYECGKENAFMCSKCGRRFPHKQNCVYHLKRKHKIVCETIDQYVSAGLVVFQGSSVGSGTNETSPAGEQQHTNNVNNLKETSVTPPPQLGSSQSAA